MPSPETVFRTQVGGPNIPPYPYKKDHFETAPWFEEQNLGDPAYVEQIDVVKDGENMTAYIIRRERWDEDEDWDRKNTPLRVFHMADSSGSLTRTYTSHYPVTSIDLLLNQLDIPQGVSKE